MDDIYLKKRQSKGNYTNFRLTLRAQTLADLLAKNRHRAPERILDIGTADGMVLSLIARALKAKQAIGVDIVEKGLRVDSAEKRNRVSLALADCQNLPFKNDTFDILIASAVIEHIHNTDTVLQEAKRVLKKGGQLCISVPNPFFDWVNTKLVKTYHVRRFTVRKMLQLLAANDLQLVSTCHFMLFPFGRIPFENFIIGALRALRIEFILFNRVFIVSKS